MAGTNSSKNINFEKPYIILKDVQLSENVGMVMRTMLNFGFKNLRIVNPKIDFHNKKVISSSAGAYDIIKDYVKVFRTLEESINDIEFLCATSVRTRDLDNVINNPNNTIKEIKRKYRHNKIGFLFGPEKAGLKNEDLINASNVINIPTISAFGSLNLAMSVNIICYEWYKNYNKSLDFKDVSKTDLANKKQVNFFNNRLIKSLHASNFFSNNKENQKLVINLKNIFLKNNLTNKELRILHGVITNLKKNEKYN